jgi:hypothetical protein
MVRARRRAGSPPWLPLERAGRAEGGQGFMPLPWMDDGIRQIGCGWLLALTATGPTVFF